jgi:hypothetical protein
LGWTETSAAPDGTVPCPAAARLSVTALGASDGALSQFSGGDRPILHLISHQRITDGRHPLIRGQLLPAIQIVAEPNPQADFALAEHARRQRRHIGQGGIAQEHTVEATGNAERHRRSRLTAIAAGAVITPVSGAASTAHQRKFELARSGEIGSAYFDPPLIVEQLRHLGDQGRSPGNHHQGSGNK